MNFAKAAFLGAVLALATPAVLADSITVTGTEASGSSGISATGISLQKNSGSYSAGSVSSTTLPTGVLTDFTGDSVLYPLQSISGNPAMKFSGSATPAGPTVANPIVFFTITDGSEVLTVYLTAVDPASIKANATGVKGTFTATGYLTITGLSSQVPITLTVTSNATGSGAKAFTATLDTLSPIPSAPEPASLALLGTGVLGIAGVLQRRRKVNSAA